MPRVDIARAVIAQWTVMRWRWWLVVLATGAPVIAAAGPATVGRDVKAVPQPGTDESKPKLVGVDITSLGPDTVPIERPAPDRRAGGPDDVWYLDVVALGTARGYTCSGVLIAPRLVLTARHCGAVTRVAVGSQIDSALAIRSVDRGIAHPDRAVDAMLLHTSADVPAPPRPRRGERDASPPSGTVRLIGFGISDVLTRSGFGTKREVDVLVHGWGCDGRRPARTGCRPDVELLVASDRGNDTCDGDSGGAALEFVDGSWRLLAITSRAVTPSIRVCGEGGVYVRADYLDSWIQRTIKELP